SLVVGAIPRDGLSSELLSQFLDKAKIRIEELTELEEESLSEERQHRQEIAVAIAAKAQQEAALSAAEREQYAAFLSLEFFTKEDFPALERFYGGAWDRLSDGGKAEMSHRVWEGVRRE